MATLLELKEKRNRLNEETNRLVKTEMTAETRAQIDQMHADWAEQGRDIARFEQAEAMDREMRASQPLPASVSGASASAVDSAEVRNKAYKAVFGKYLRGGSEALNHDEIRTLSLGRVSNLESRDLTGASGANGSYLIETDLQKDLQVALKSFGGMRNVAKPWKTAQGNPVTLPLLNDTQNPGKRLNATSVPGTVSELDLTFGQTVFGVWTYTTQKISVSNELLRDASIDLESIIRDAFVVRIGRIQNTEFTLGTGSSMPVGLVTGSPVTFTAAVGGTSVISYQNLIDFTHSLDPAYRMNAKFMFHDTTLAIIRKITDTQNRPLLGLGINGSDAPTVIGYNYQINQDMPIAAANAKSMLFGDFASAYMIRDVGDFKISRLSELGALTNETIFVGFSAADGQVVNSGVPASVAFAQSAT
jgi:HK97 family phage major capsid protein